MNRDDDPDSFFTIKSIEEMDNVPDRHSVVEYSTAWVARCRVTDTYCDYDQKVSVMESGDGELYKSSDTDGM